MWKLKNCPRCGGDVFLDSEEHIWYEQCLQCGYRHELRTVAEFDKPPAGVGKEPSLSPVRGGTARSGFVPGVATRSHRYAGRRRRA